MPRTRALKLPWAPHSRVLVLFWSRSWIYFLSIKAMFLGFPRGNVHPSVPFPLATLLILAYTYYQYQSSPFRSQPQSVSPMSGGTLHEFDYPCRTTVEYQYSEMRIKSSSLWPRVKFLFLSPSLQALGMCLCILVRNAEYLRRKMWRKSHAALSSSRRNGHEASPVWLFE